MFFGRKAMTNLDSVLECRDITLPTKVCIVKVIFFSISQAQMWELNHKQGWVLKNWYFQTVVLEKTLESSLDSKESNKSILEEINPEHSLEVLLLKLKLQYFGYVMQRADSLEKTVILGKIEGRKRRGGRGWGG